LKGFDYGGEGLANLSRKGESYTGIREYGIGGRGERTEDCVNDMVCVFECSGKVVGERDIEILELSCKTLCNGLGHAMEVEILRLNAPKMGWFTYLVQIILALLWVVDRRLVAIMPKMSRSYETISTCESHSQILFS
jgi:hypothetical protein